ncbi:MAG: hypothetical protein AAB637_00830 [Patescibacteria group bacterium]
MSSQAKGLLGVVLSIIGLFSSALVLNLNLLSNAYRDLLTVKVIIPLLISIIGLYLGIIARKNGAKIWGLIAIVLGLIGTLGHILRLFGFGN